MGDEEVATKVREIKQKIGLIDNDGVTAELLAGYVPIEGTLATKIVALHERIVAGDIAPDQVALLKATAERDAAELKKERGGGGIGNQDEVAAKRTAAAEAQAKAEAARDAARARAEEARARAAAAKARAEELAKAKEATAAGGGAGVPAAAAALQAAKVKREQEEAAAAAVEEEAAAAAVEEEAATAAADPQSSAQDEASPSKPPLVAAKTRPMARREASSGAVMNEQPTSSLDALKRAKAAREAERLRKQEERHKEALAKIASSSALDASAGAAPVAPSAAASTVGEGGATNAEARRLAAVADAKREAAEREAAEREAAAEKAAADRRLAAEAAAAERAAEKAAWALAERERAAGMDESKLRAIFAQFDADGSGSVSLDELSAMVASLQASGVSIDVTPDRLEALIREADADGSGEIEFDEFVTVLRAQLTSGEGGGGLASLASLAGANLGWLNPLSWFGLAADSAEGEGSGASGSSPGKVDPSAYLSAVQQASEPPASSCLSSSGAAAPPQRRRSSFFSTRKASTPVRDLKGIFSTRDGSKPSSSGKRARFVPMPSAAEAAAWVRGPAASKLLGLHEGPHASVGGDASSSQSGGAAGASASRVAGSTGRRFPFSSRDAAGKYVRLGSHWTLREGPRGSLRRTSDGSPIRTQLKDPKAVSFGAASMDEADGELPAEVLTSPGPGKVLVVSVDGPTTLFIRSSSSGSSHSAMRQPDLEAAGGAASDDASPSAGAMGGLIDPPMTEGISRFVDETLTALGVDRGIHRAAKSAMFASTLFAGFVLLALLLHTENVRRMCVQLQWGAEAGAHRCGYAGQDALPSPSPSPPQGGLFG